MEDIETDLDFNVMIRFNSFRALGVANRHGSRSRRAKKAVPLPQLVVNPEAAGCERKRIVSL